MVSSETGSNPGSQLSVAMPHKKHRSCLEKYTSIDPKQFQQNVHEYVMRKSEDDMTFENLHHCCIRNKKTNPDKAVEKGKRRGHAVDKRQSSDKRDNDKETNPDKAWTPSEGGEDAKQDTNPWKGRAQREPQ